LFAAVCITMEQVDRMTCRVQDKLAHWAD
jgi:hypothetical protein